MAFYTSDALFFYIPLQPNGEEICLLCIDVPWFISLCNVPIHASGILAIFYGELHVHWFFLLLHSFCRMNLQGGGLTCWQMGNKRTGAWRGWEACSANLPSHGWREPDPRFFWFKTSCSTPVSGCLSHWFNFKLFLTAGSGNPFFFWCFF